MRGTKEARGRGALWSNPRAKAGDRETATHPTGRKKSSANGAQVGGVCEGGKQKMQMAKDRVCPERKLRLSLTHWGGAEVV